jgi:hypothetical protein
MKKAITNSLTIHEFVFIQARTLGRKPTAPFPKKPPLLGARVAQRALVDAQFPRDLRDRLTRLPDQPHRTLLEVLIELPRCLRLAQLLKAMSLR